MAITVVIWGVVILGALIVIPIIIETNRAPMNEAQRHGAPGRFVTLSQGVTHYQWLGPVRGPVVVCVHGLTTPSFVWGGLTRGLALLGFRVLIYDLYGRGYSDRPRGPQDTAFFLRQLKDLLHHERVEDDITLIGYSMGGAIATAFSANAPGRLRQLVLLAPAGMGMARTPLMRFVIDTPVIGDWVMLAFYPSRLRKGLRAERDLPSAVENITRLQENELEYRGFVPAVLASLRGILSHPMQAEHQTIHRSGIPVLAIWGREDSVIPLSSVGKLAEWSRDSRQDVIDGAGHGLTYTHCPEVLAILRDFLRHRD